MLMKKRCIEPLMGRFFGILGKLPPRMVAAQISRTGIAIAALMIAVSAVLFYSGYKGYGIKIREEEQAKAEEETKEKTKEEIK